MIVIICYHYAKHIKIKNTDAVAIKKREKNIDIKNVDGIKMLRFSETKVEKEECYCTQKNKFWDNDANNIDIKKLTETKNNSKYLVGYLDVISFDMA